MDIIEFLTPKHPQVRTLGHDLCNIMKPIRYVLNILLVRTHTKFGINIFEIDFVIERGSSTLWKIYIEHCACMEFLNVVPNFCLAYAYCLSGSFLHIYIYFLKIEGFILNCI